MARPTRDGMSGVPREAGKSSFELLDADALLAALPLASARRVLDLGCGAGAYTLFLAERLAPGATILGVDLWPKGVALLQAAAEDRGLRNVTAAVADLARLLSVPDGDADFVLLATVIHDLAERGAASEALREAARVLRPGGLLGAVEFKKADTRPGPPLAVRLAPGELAALAEPCGFGPPQVVDLGPNLYLALFPRAAAAEGKGCDRCGAALTDGEGHERGGRTLCEDCLMDALSPVKACDPWAVKLAKGAKDTGGTGELRGLEKTLYEMVLQRGRVPKEAVPALLSARPAEVDRAFAVLRHMELLRGERRTDGGADLVPFGRERGAGS